MDTPPYIPEGAAKFRASDRQTGEKKQESPNTIGGFSIKDVVDGKQIFAFTEEDGKAYALLVGPSKSEPSRTGIKRVPLELLSQRHIDQAGGLKIGDTVQCEMGGEMGDYQVKSFMVIDGQMKALVGYADEDASQKRHEVNADWINVAELKKTERLN